MRHLHTWAMRWLLLLIIVQLLSACTFMQTKPVMPIAESMTVYLIETKPAPTVLLFSGCGGVQGKNVKNNLPRKAKWLNEHGFNAVVFDYVSFFGLENACYGQIKTDVLVKTAIDAFHYTAAQPFVERDRIVLLGWSMGASMALSVAAESAPDQQPAIAAVAAYYPGCYPGLRLSTYPTLMLVGLADNVVNPADCLSLAKLSPQTPLTLKTYAGAHHNFDVIEFKEPQTTHFFWKEFTSAYDPVAADDAEKALADFLKKYN